MKKLTPDYKYRRPTFRPRLESLEARLTPTTYTVSSLADSGAGSLRAAITSVNGDHASDTIDFSVAGVIKLTSGALPAITTFTSINGATAPGFTGAPVVEIDNNGFAGLSVYGNLVSLSIVNAKGPGVTLYGTAVGNYIGLALDGSVAANTGVGLLIPEGAVNNTIGGTTAAARNVISGNGAGGIQISGQAYVQGNFIGTDPSGQAPAGNHGNGVTITDSFNTSIGGILPGVGNTIAYNSGYGVVVDTGYSNAISENSIFHNGAGGIFLVNGGNLNQIAPVLTSAFQPTPTTTEVSGTLVVQTNTGLDSRNWVVQIFATLPGMPPGQGQVFLGSLIVSSNPTGSASFVFRTSFATGSGTSFTATATGPMFQAGGGFNNTSAFAQAIPLTTDPNTVYVLNAYALLLNRAPDPGSLVWVNALNKGATPASVVLGIQGSPEYLSDQVFALYNRYLGRNPDPVGGLAWINFLLAGGSLEQVAAGLATSAEFFVDQGTTSLGYLNALYQDVLNRAPGKPELVAWQTAFDAGASRRDVAVGLLTSQEYRADLVQTDYLTFLLRTADPLGLTSWVSALNAGATDQQVLAGIFGSAEGYQLWS